MIGLRLASKTQKLLFKKWTDALSARNVETDSQSLRFRLATVVLPKK